MLKVANKIFVAMCCVVAVLLCGCEDVVVEVVKSNAYLKTDVVKGDSKNCAVVLEAQQGTSYSISIASDGDWAKFSTKETYAEGQMDAVTKVVYIYFSKNASGESRVANVDVVLGGEIFSLSFTQESYDSSIAFVRDWAELPICKEENNYIYNSHYGEMGSKTNARNYTYCFDPKVRASLWVAYPVHNCYNGIGSWFYQALAGICPDEQQPAPPKYRQIHRRRRRYHIYCLS